MPPSTAVPAGNQPGNMGFATRVAGLYVAIFILGGIQMPFFPVWLKAKGLDAGMIGLVLSVPQLVRVLAIPLATRLADRREALRETIVLAAALSVLGYLLVGFADGAWLILAAYVVASLVYTPVMPLTEAYALRGLAARGIAYGPVRLWGSAAFIGGSFMAGIAADVLPAQSLIWLIVAATGIIAASAVTLARLPPMPPPQATAPARPLWRDPLFIAVALAASLIQGSHAMYYGFSALAWTAQGFDGTAIAALWAIGIVAEIVLFAFSNRLPLWLTPQRLILIGAAGGVLRWTAMALDPPAALLPVLQTLHALTFGTTHLGTLTLLVRHAPHGQGATAQGYLAVAMGAVMAAMTGLSGALFARYGGAAYAAMALAALAGGAVVLMAARLLRARAREAA